MMFCRLSLVALLAVAASAQTDTSGRALFQAIERGAVGDVERLLRPAHNPNAVDADGTPALMTATVFANAAMVDVLLKHGADANRVGPAGATALLWAVPDVDKVRLLIAHGANVNARSETDRTALLVAASYPRTVNLLKLLLERGADLRAQDRGGSTALSLAIRSADIDVVQFLVARDGSDRAVAGGAAGGPGPLRPAHDRLSAVESADAGPGSPGHDGDVAARRSGRALARPRGKRERWRRHGRPVREDPADERRRRRRRRAPTRSSCCSIGAPIRTPG